VSLDQAAGSSGAGDGRPESIGKRRTAVAVRRRGVEDLLASEGEPAATRGRAAQERGEPADEGGGIRVRDPGSGATQGASGNTGVGGGGTLGGSSPPAAGGLRYPISFKVSREEYEVYKLYAKYFGAEAILEKWREDLREIGRRYGESLRQAEESVRATLGGKGIRV
jgi:hypothetical protein